MSNAFGAGNKSVQTGNMLPTPNRQGNARPTPSRRPSPFILRAIKIVGTFALTFLAFRILGPIGILIVGLGVVGFFYIDKKAMQVGKTLKVLIATGVFSKVGKIVGIILAIGGIGCIVGGVIRSLLLVSGSGIGLVVAGIVVWIISYSLRP